MNQPIVNVQNLSHRYAKEWAVRDIAFSIDKTGIVGLLGSNGAGKSTIMNIMCGVLFPSMGDVLIDGYSIRKQPIEAKRRIGFLPQQVPLYPELTVHEYLTYCANLRRMAPAAIPAAVEEAKERCGVAHFSRRLIGALSGGYRQRCGIAQAILHEPSLVVLDEPTTGLDPVQILSVRKLIKEISAERTVLISTHILPEVEALCEDIKMIERGRIVFEGSLDDFAGVVASQSLIAVFNNPPSTDALSALPGVDEAEAVTRRKYRLRFSDATGLSHAVIHASVNNDWGLEELYFERSSLEAVFARLAAPKAEAA